MAHPMQHYGERKQAKFIEPDNLDYGVGGLAKRIVELSETYYGLGNHGDGLPRIDEEEALWLADQIINHTVWVSGTGAGVGEETP